MDGVRLVAEWAAVGVGDAVGHDGDPPGGEEFGVVGEVQARDAETGEQVWFNEYNDVVPTGGPNGVAIAYGNAYFTLGGLADVIGARAQIDF